MESRRVARVERALRDVLGMRISSHLQGELKGFVSVTRVKAAPDLRQARIFVSVIGSSNDESWNLRLLEESARDLQAVVARELPMRYCPRLLFQADHAYEQALQVHQVIKNEGRGE